MFSRPYRKNTIVSIAKRLGWEVSILHNGEYISFEFQRKTISCVPFSFVADMKDGTAEGLVKEVESFVDAIDPVSCAREWMIKTRLISSSRLQQAVRDMEAIRSDAKLLANKLEDADRSTFLENLPWNLWN